VLEEEVIRRCFDQRCHDLERYMGEGRIWEARREAGGVIALAYVLECDLPERYKAIFLRLMRYRRAAARCRTRAEKRIK
jgi:hypothetical protein